MASMFTGNEEWRRMSDEAIGSAGLLADRYPSMVGHHLAMAHSSATTKELAIVGDSWRDLAAVYWSRYRPNIVLAPASGASDVPLLEGRTDHGRTLAYVCQDFICVLPTEDPEKLAQQLD